MIILIMRATLLTMTIPRGQRRRQIRDRPVTAVSTNLIMGTLKPREKASTMPAPWSTALMTTMPHVPTGLDRYHSAMRSRRVRGTLGPAAEARSMDVLLMMASHLRFTVVSPPPDRLKQGDGEDCHPCQVDETVDSGRTR